MSHTARILVVDDDPAVLSLVTTILRHAGFDVTAATGGRDALRTVQFAPNRIDLLLTDVVMPDLPGPELADDCTRLRPDLRVMFMTGYPQRAIGNTIVKPFTATALVDRVQDALRIQ